MNKSINIGREQLWQMDPPRSTGLRHLDINCYFEMKCTDCDILIRSFVCNMKRPAVKSTKLSSNLADLP